MKWKPVPGCEMGQLIKKPRVEVGQRKRKGQRNKKVSRVSSSINRRARLIKEYGKKCVHCGTSEAFLTMDHIWPKSRGGDNRTQNLQLLCRLCHDIKDNSKKDKIARMFRSLRVIEKWK